MFLNEVTVLNILILIYLLINITYGLISGVLCINNDFIWHIIYYADCLQDVNKVGRIIAVILFCLIMIPGIVLSLIIYVILILGLLIFRLFVKLFKSKEAKERDKLYKNYGDIIN